MQVDLFPGVSTLLLAPDGSEIAIHDIEVMLHHQRAIVGGSPQTTNQSCLSVAEELLVIQRLQQHQDYLRTSGFSNVFASGTDGFGASATGEIGTWDLGVFQENLRRGAEQIVRSIRQSRDPHERVMSQDDGVNGPSRTPSQYARQTEHVNRIIRVLQDVYFTLAKRPQVSPRVAQQPTLANQNTSPLPDATSLTSTAPTTGVASESLPYTPSSMQRNMPNSVPLNRVPQRSFTTGHTLNVPSTVPGAMENRSVSYALASGATDGRATKPSFSEEAVLRTQQLTEALKPKTISRKESTTGLSWTRSLSRRKSKKKLSRTISNPHLVSTTQNLDNTIDLVNLPRNAPLSSTATLPADVLARSSQHSGSSHNTTRPMHSREPSLAASGAQRYPTTTERQPGLKEAGSPVPKQGFETMPASPTDATTRVSNASQPSSLASRLNSLRVSDTSAPSGNTGALAVPPSGPSASQTPVGDVSTSSVVDLGAGTRTDPLGLYSEMPSTPSMVSAPDTASPEGAAGTTSPSSTGSAGIRKSLLVNMGIQLPSPQLAAFSLPPSSPHTQQPSPRAMETVGTASPAGVPGGTPSTMPSATPRATPGAMPSAVPNAMPAAMPSAVPSAMPSEMSTTAPSATPSAMSSLASPPSTVLSRTAPPAATGVSSPIPVNTFSPASPSSSPAMPIAAQVPGLGPIESPKPARVASLERSPDVSYYTSHSYADVSGGPTRDRASQAMASVRDSHTGEIITFPSEDDVADDRSEAATEVQHEAAPAPGPTLSTPVKHRSAGVHGATHTSPSGLEPSNSLGESVYDMYMGLGKSEEDGLFKKSGIPMLRDDDPRASRLVRLSRAAPSASASAAAASASPRLGRSDNPIWQVVAGLHDRSSMYSELEAPSQRFSDLSGMSRREYARVPSEHSVTTEQEEAHEADRALFKGARSAQPQLPMFADFDAMGLPSDTAMVPRAASTPPPRSEASTPQAPSEADERNVPVQVVYYRDEELPEIMERIAQGTSSARIEFRRRSSVPDAPPTSGPVSAPEGSAPPTPRGEEVDEVPDVGTGKDEEDTQLAKVEQSILSLLRPTLSSLRGL
ncbi:hypothetical protein MBRA1_003127 [Malassezia brasiliensis]|uniref:Uncharacterized protein n=1 Tax=Malassezia brasiliensis TaxID=1821822 RepID=A0AAF0DUB9_9BASI|nr:hypothetical protein MBRA1_003127 [Malassezia brasiliensis]